MLSPGTLRERLGSDGGAPVILDGGLATALEARGFDLDDPLWSAKVLIEAPEAIREVHEAFLQAGADCITSASYQASLPGFAARGIDHEHARRLITRAVDLAVQARDAFWAQEQNRAGRVRPLVAASVGPYGAYLADGSEYTGAYGVEDEALYAFHAERWQLLAASGADLLACETIPSVREVAVLLRLLRETPNVSAWLSMSCGTGESLWDGTPIAEVARLCEASDNLVAIGVNCVKPVLVEPLLTRLGEATPKALIAYPNAGEEYDAATRRWLPAPGVTAQGGEVSAWLAAGARLLGGCCRVGPERIRALRAAVDRAR
ncbi:MAG: homocysteine S-methyltransferase [Pseudomonadota bacterium]